MKWEAEIEQWIRDNRSLIDSCNFNKIVDKFDSDCYEDQLVCSFDSQDRFYIVLGYLLGKSFTILKYEPVEIILSLRDEMGVDYTLYSYSDILVENIEKIFSLSDFELKELMAKSLSTDRNISLEITRKIVEKALIKEE